MAEKRFYYRESVISLLRSIAAEAPGESLDELVCGWFDDLYLPGFDPEDSNPGVNERCVADFNDCFHTKELQALELFHHTFNALLKNIPNDIHHEELSLNENWQKIKLAAAKTLEAFNP